MTIRVLIKHSPSKTHTINWISLLSSTNSVQTINKTYLCINHVATAIQLYQCAWVDVIAISRVYTNSKLRSGMQIYQLIAGLNHIREDLKIKEE